MAGVEVDHRSIERERLLDLAPVELVLGHIRRRLAGDRCRCRKHLAETVRLDRKRCTRNARRIQKRPSTQHGGPSGAKNTLNDANDGTNGNEREVKIAGPRHRCRGQKALGSRRSRSFASLCPSVLSYGPHEVPTRAAAGCRIAPVAGGVVRPDLSGLKQSLPPRVARCAHGWSAQKRCRLAAGSWAKTAILPTTDPVKR